MFSYTHQHIFAVITFTKLCARIPSIYKRSPRVFIFNISETGKQIPKKYKIGHNFRANGYLNIFFLISLLSNASQSPEIVLLKASVTIKILYFNDLNDKNWFNQVLSNRTAYSYFEKGCRKKSIKVHATRPKGGQGIHWNFAYWPRGNLQVCVFARGKFVFPLRSLCLQLYFSCRMS